MVLTVYIFIYIYKMKGRLSEKLLSYKNGMGGHAGVLVVGAGFISYITHGNSKCGCGGHKIARASLKTSLFLAPGAGIRG